MANGATSATSRPRGMTIGLVVLGLAIVGLIVGIAVVASSDDGGGPHAVVTTTTTVAPTTTPVVIADPQGDAVALFNAWKVGDRAAATRVASPDAVNQMFAAPYQAQPSPTGPVDPFSFEGCQGAAGSTFCTWTARGSTIAIRVTNMTGLVVEVRRSP